MNTDVICEFGRLRRPPSARVDLEAFESRMSIINTLIAMRKLGLFRMVYCDADQLAVVLPSAEDISGALRQNLSWMNALAMVEEFNQQSAAINPTNVERKPPARSETPKEAKKWAK